MPEFFVTINLHVSSQKFDFWQKSNFWDSIIPCKREAVKRSTQADVARLAGVSRATVSYVINKDGDSKRLVSGATRQRVLDAIEELGYAPDARARSLRSGDTKTVGLLISQSHNPHYWEVVQGAEDELEKEGYHLLFSSTSLDPNREWQILHSLLRRRMDALILTLSFMEQSKEILQQLISQGYPVVTLGKIAFDTDAVMTTYRNATRELMTHLLALGHQRIGFVFGVGSPDLGKNRMTIYKEALTEAGLPVDESLIDRCGINLEDSYRAALRLLSHEPRPTALLVINDWLAIGALRAAAEKGLRVPDDLSIASFDNTELAAYLFPPLTSIRSAGHEIGRQAAKLALDRIQDPQRPLRRVQIEAQVVYRGSTGPAPAL
jgi:LacI family transcriptional regulator